MAHRGRQSADERLAAELAAGKTVRDAAAAAGVAERTAHRRQADPSFRRRVSELRGEMVAQALGKVADAMSEASDGLRKLLSAKSETVRLAACRAILETGVKLRESVEPATPKREPTPEEVEAIRERLKMRGVNLDRVALSMN